MESTAIAKYRESNPMKDPSNTWITDGGMYTYLLLEKNLPFNYFCAYTLLENEEGVEQVKAYYRLHAEFMMKHGHKHIMMDALTWHASQKWANLLGEKYNKEYLAELNKKAVEVLTQIREEYPELTIVINGAVGPRDDAYKPETMMTPDEAEAYHSVQIATLKETGADIILAETHTYYNECIGIVRATKKHGFPCYISFTTETDGKLPSGQTLEEAIEAIDKETDNYVTFYLINCAHPDHFEEGIKHGRVGKDKEMPRWMIRIKGVLVNASRKSHAELEVATELDSGNAKELAQQLKSYKDTLGWHILGGCCGTNHTHIEEVVKNLKA